MYKNILEQSCPMQHCVILCHTVLSILQFSIIPFHFAHMHTSSQSDQYPQSLYLVFSAAFWGAKGAPILFSEIGFCVASCSYI